MASRSGTALGTASARRPFRIPVGRLLLVTALVDVVLLAGTGVHEHLKGSTLAVKPLTLLSLAQEATVGAWWSSAVLGAAGTGFCLVAAARLLDRQRRPRAVGPTSVGLVLLGLSLDEVASIHERMIMSDTAGVDRTFDGPGPWLVPVLPALVLVVLGTRRVAGRGVGTATWLAWSGALCLSTILLQEDLEHTLFAGRSRPAWSTVAEEGTELLGSLLLLAAALRLLGAVRPEAREVLWQTLRRRSLQLATLGGTLLVLGTVAADVFVRRTVGDDQLGLPQYWTGSIAAGALAAAVAGWSGRTADRGPRSAHLLVVGTTLLALLHGIDGLTWMERSTGSDLPLRIGLAVLCFVPAVLLARTSARGPGALTAAAAIALLLDGGVASWAQVAALSAAAVAWWEAPPRPAPSPELLTAGDATAEERGDR